MARIFFPLPNRDFDPTESAVPWRLLTNAGHEVVFATPDGAPAACDPLLLTGVVLGQLGAHAEPRAFYAEMLKSPAFNNPIRYDALDVLSYDAAWYSGGHAQGMKPYLENEVLRAHTRGFWASKRPVAAICHGVLVLARAGVLQGVKTSCLPKYMELAAWGSTVLVRGNYYRTYPETVEDEVRRLGGLVQPDPLTLFSHGTAENDGPAFVVEEGHYLSARWPGDAYLLAKRFMAKLAAG